MKTLLLALLSFCSLLALAPNGAAATTGGKTVVAGTFESKSEKGLGDGTVVSDGNGSVSFTSEGGSGAVWKKEETGGPYKKQDPEDDEEDLELRFEVTETDAEGNPTEYGWELTDGKDKTVDRGTLSKV